MKQKRQQSDPTKNPTDGNSNKDNHTYFILQIAIDVFDDIIASYDKMNICNYGVCAETRFFPPGNTETSFSLGFWKLGILLLADIRYSLTTRSLVGTHGDALLQPSCFFRNESFQTRRSVRETWAVENGTDLLAGNYGGRDFGHRP